MSDGGGAAGGAAAPGDEALVAAAGTVAAVPAAAPAAPPDPAPAARRPRIPELDLIRAVACVGIVLYHVFTKITVSEIYDVVKVGNSDWGAVFVTVFFVLSGFSLQYSVRRCDRTYAWKRFKSIFVPYYVAFAIYHIRAVFDHGGRFWGGRTGVELIWTLLGLDGYLNYRTLTYYQVGEWFLGGLILLYAMYPALRWLLEHAEAATTALVLALYVAVIWTYHTTDFWQISSSRNLVACLAPFWVGMVLCRHREAVFGSRWYWLAGALLFAAGFVVDDSSIAGRLMGVGAFLVLYAVGHVVMRARPVARAASWVAGLSYAVFLVHHRVIYDAAAFTARITSWGGVVKVLACLLVIIWAAGWALRQVADAVLRTRWFRWLDDRMMGRTGAGAGGAAGAADVGAADVGGAAPGTAGAGGEAAGAGTDGSPGETAGADGAGAGGVGVVAAGPAPGGEG